VRWGSDDHSRRCRTREQALATFDRGLRQGMEAEITELVAGPAGVMVGFELTRPRREHFFHAYLTRDGMVAEMRRLDDRSSALAAIGEAR
jgi:hypothetical protein